MNTRWMLLSIPKGKWELITLEELERAKHEIKRVAAEFGKQLATPDEARRILGL